MAIVVLHELDDGHALDHSLSLGVRKDAHDHLLADILGIQIVSRKRWTLHQLLLGDQRWHGILRRIDVVQKLGVAKAQLVSIPTQHRVLLRIGQKDAIGAKNLLGNVATHMSTVESGKETPNSSIFI